MKTLKNKLAALLFLVSLLAIPMPALAAKDPCANTPDQKSIQNCVSKNPITHQIQVIVNFLSIGVGLVVILMIIMGGVQYVAAGDSPEALKNARARITNALIALVVYIFAFAFLQWLIPGGLFS